MLLSPEFVRWVILIGLLSIACLTCLYLRRRSLTPQAYLSWGLLAILLPLIGPFLVLLNKPGKHTQDFHKV
jgi:hypothetical protein